VTLGYGTHSSMPAPAAPAAPAAVRRLRRLHHTLRTPALAGPTAATVAEPAAVAYDVAALAATERFLREPMAATIGLGRIVTLYQIQYYNRHLYF
jgi:hypothetical protein